MARVERDWAPSTHAYNSQEGEELEGFQQGPRSNTPQPRGQMREGTLKSTTRKYFLVRSPVLLVTVCQRETRVKQDQTKWEPEYSSGKSLKWFMGGWARFLKVFSSYPSLLFRI